MADFCWDCCERHLGVEGEKNDMLGLCEEDEIVHVLCEGCGEITVNKKGQRVNNFTRAPQLSNEMTEWLEKHSDLFEPLLKYNFMLEFGYKHSGVPDSLSIKVAGELVEEWKKKNNENHCN